jgi:hypothetical protein
MLIFQSVFARHPAIRPAPELKLAFAELNVPDE